MHTRPHAPESSASICDDGDRDLVKRFLRNRDEAAFAELVRRYRGLVFGVAQRVLHQQQDVEDVFQATFLVLARDASGIRKRASIAGWLYGVAWRIALKARAGKQRRAEEPFRDETMNHADPFTQIAERSDLQALDEELNELPEKYREALVRHYLVGRSAPQIADDLQLSVSAVEGRLKRGRDRLRKRLTRRGVGLAVVLGALELSRQSAAAYASDTLVANTVTAGLNDSASGQTSSSYSPEAARLAAKEIGHMTTTSLGTATALTLSATLLVGLAIGLSGQTLSADTGDTATADSARLDVPAATEDTPAAIVLAQANTNKQPNKANTQNSNNAVVRRRPVRPTLDYRKRSRTEEKIYQQLQAETTLDFVETPLKDVMEFLSELHSIPILLNERELSDLGIDTDAQVSLQLKKITLESSLRIILGKFDLDYVVRNEVLEITSELAAASHMETHVYEIRHLKHIPADELVKTIRETIHPDTWKSQEAKKKTSPRGAISTLGGALIVTHNQRVNGAVMDLLEQLARHAPDTGK